MAYQFQKEAWRMRRGKLISPAELGTIVPENVHSINGCHAPGSSSMASYYRQNIPIPSNIDDCSDDVSMVRFDSVAFTYIYRPPLFDTDPLVATYRKLGIAHGTVDVIVWTQSGETLRNITAKSFIDMTELLPLLENKQNEELGYQFTADNPWVTSPPDIHPCMPGIPDDESNILLWLLLLKDYHS